MQNKENSLNNVLKVKAQGFLNFKKESNTEYFPKAFSDYTKSFGSIYFWEEGGFHVVTEAKLARSLLKDPRLSADRSAFFISRMPKLDLSLIGDFFGVVQKMMVMSDGPEHQARRKCAAEGINDQFLSLFEIKIQESVEELLSPLTKKKEFEFVEEVAKILPATVLAKLFNIPDQDRAAFYKHSNTMTAFFGGASSYLNEDGIAVNEAALELKNYFQALIKKRKDKPERDFITGMLHSQKFHGLTDDEIISQSIMMLVAGQVTTTDQIGNNIYALYSNPQLLKLLQVQEKTSDATIESILEELTRLDPAVSFLFRVAKEDLIANGQFIKKNDTVFIANHAVNRDSVELSNPDSVNLSNKSSNHFSYGHGAHYCLGARLGRMQIKILTKAILEKLPNITLKKDLCQRDHYSLSFSGFKELPFSNLIKA